MASPLACDLVFRFADFEADPRARELRRGGAPVLLQDQPFHVLAALLERAGELVTREDLRRLLWSDDTFVDFDHGLNTAMRKVRDALGDSAQAPRFIETLPKRGYRFLGPVQRVSPPTAEVQLLPGTPAAAPTLSMSAAPVVDTPRATSPGPLALHDRKLGLLGRSLLAAGAGLALLLASKPAGWRGAPLGSAERIRSLDVLPRSTDATAEKRRVRAPSTTNAEAYDLFLRGKVHLRRENQTDNAAAIGLLERAIALEPKFAAAHAMLATAYATRIAFFAPADAAALERAQVAAGRALDLDPGLAEAHYAAGVLLWGVLPDRFMHERAVSELKRAISLDPDLSEAHHYLGGIYLHIGLLDQAVAEFQKTLALEPSDHDSFRRIGLVLVYRGRYEEGLRALRQVPSGSSPSLWHYQMAWALLYLGRNEEARTLIDQYLQAHPEDRGGVVTSLRAIWFAKAGDQSRAEADIRVAVPRAAGYIHFHHTAYNIASAYALLGKPAEALRWLREAARTGWPCYPYFAADPNLEPLHSDPGYLSFMDELKAQWELYRSTL
jgi:DNA-binding winged helix-turn-helix (wHTH) protein/tetratricopeptide (TPR) repeat protein